MNKGRFDRKRVRFIVFILLVIFGTVTYFLVIRPRISQSAENVQYEDTSSTDENSIDDDTSNETLDELLNELEDLDDVLAGNGK